MRNDSEIFRRILTGFVAKENPLLSMLKWMMEQLMQIEAEQKVGAQKGEHSDERKSYFSAYRPRRFDTRVGTVYLMIPRIRKGGYVHFMRNIVAHIPPKSKERFAASWLQESKKEAMMIAQAIIREFGQRYPEAIDVLEAGLEDSLQF
jgi:transposase-like protein